MKQLQDSKLHEVKDHLASTIAHEILKNHDHFQNFIISGSNGNMKEAENQMITN